MKSESERDKRFHDENLSLLLLNLIGRRKKQFNYLVTLTVTESKSRKPEKLNVSCLLHITSLIMNYSS